MAGRSRGKRAPRSWTWLVAALLLVGMWQLLERRDGPPLPAGSSTGPALAVLPAEAHATLALIDRGGPSPHRQHGGVIQNRARPPPARPRRHHRALAVA